ncbi:hypothetical protein M1N23_01620 [Dehalococcoidia bacterium]|nr:hypothetical protein [Dehalococcoidia bacterium]
MKALVVGSGAREHTMAWKIKQSPLRPDIYVAPGNAGTADIAENVPIDSGNIEELLKFAVGKAIDITLVGPEAPLAAGLVDLFNESDSPVFGPRRAAAAIESSKSFAKGLMQRAGVPTAHALIFDSIGEALGHIARSAPPLGNQGGWSSRRQGSCNGHR